MEILLNGERKKLNGGMTVEDLLKDLGIDPAAVVVERNLSILNRKDHGVQSLSDGDTVEIIQMVDGG
ncbi:MAG: sulfur carrier protein ThiS [bacterium]|nr:MAG: sulfur carrier protein ThiS [bacterium]